MGSKKLTAKSDIVPHCSTQLHSTSIQSACVFMHTHTTRTRTRAHTHTPEYCSVIEKVIIFIYDNISCS